MGSKNCPETPRQKMISMMYLVLTALLALNVSKDILEAFVTVNNGLNITVETFTKKNDLAYNAFKNQKDIQGERVEKYWKQAQEVQKLTKDLIDYIKGIRTQIIAYTEFGIKTKAEDPEKWTFADTSNLKAIAQKSNYDKPMEILIGFKEGGTDGEGEKLRQKIEKYKADLLAMIPEGERKKLNLGMNTEPYFNKDHGKNMPWAFNNFYHTVLAADVVILNKLIVDIKNIEADIVAKLFSQISAEDFPFDMIVAKVVPKSNYVLQGTDYEADIFVSAYDSKNNPTITIDGGGEVPADSGIGKYKVSAGAEGLKKYSGTIQVQKKSGATVSYPFNSEYIVAKPTAIVSPTKMNVFYIGVDNDVSISVPGIPAEKISASMTGGSLTKVDARGNYIVICDAGTTKATVNVTADFNGTKKSMGSVEFRVKKVPNPTAQIAGTEGGPVPKNALLGSAVVPIMKDFDFPLWFKVTSFKVSAVIGGDVIDIPVQGNLLSDKAKSTIQKMNKGNRLYIEEIKAVQLDKNKKPVGAERKLNAIPLTTQ